MDLKKPREGSKRRIIYDLLHRPEGATLAELNRATGWDAFSYINDTKRIARDYGGIPHVNGGGKHADFGSLDEFRNQPVERDHPAGAGPKST